MAEPPAQAQDGYEDLLAALKRRIHEAQQRAAQELNRGLVALYWGIGQEILSRQDDEGWGSQVIPRLAKDLRSAFPDSRGFSERNLMYMSKLAREWPDPAIVQQLLHKLPWSHLCVLMDKVKEQVARDWYIRSAVEHGWSRNVLGLHIERGLFESKGQAQTNFSRVLPAPQSDLAREALRDPYKLDFLGLAEDAHERAIEAGLVEHLRKFLQELGAGFAFLGNQYHLKVAQDDFYIDLLLYHVRLHCYVVIEVKAREFKPEDVGQLNFYVTAADHQLKQAEDNPTIGLLLCKGKNELAVQYSLEGISKALGVSEYRLESELPTVEQLEEELDRRLDELESGD